MLQPSFPSYHSQHSPFGAFASFTELLQRSALATKPPPAIPTKATKTALTQIVHDLNSAGDTNVRYPEFDSEDPKNGGVGGHGHQA